MSIKTPYELSLWEDVLNLEDGVYEERYLLTIAADTMTSESRAFNLTLTENINGTVSLAFSLYYKYFDHDTNEFVDNPFLSLLVNERRLKLKIENNFSTDWYDLVIKDIQENSSTKMFTYTATSLHINELSKNGFELEFATELENNSGTITELATEVMSGTDWVVDVDNSDIIQQYLEEPLYKATVNSDLSVTDMNDLDGDPIVIPEGDTVYIFYSIVSEEEEYCQLLYCADGVYTYDSDGVITNSPNYYCLVSSYDTTFTFSSTDYVSEYRGDRLVRKQLTAYDSVMDKYVLVYEDASQNTIYGYTESEYITPTVITNIVTNSSAFVSSDGWSCNTGVTVTPSYSDYTTYLNFTNTTANALVYNSGVYINRSSINNFTAGEKYRLRIKATNYSTLRAKIGIYTLSNGTYSAGNEYFAFSSSWSTVDSDGYCYIDATCKLSATYAELYSSNIGLFFYRTTTGTTVIEDVQIFAIKYDADNNVLTPDSTWSSCINTLYYYYNKPSEDITSADDIPFLYKENSPSDDYSAVYSSDYEKVRSFEESESNRFNILQTLAETFECWVQFNINHDEDGKIVDVYDEDGNLITPAKSICFKEFIGKENFSGFRYGINLKSIQRKLDSSNIVSKIIVSNNSNEYATGGFCSISRSDQSPTKENFLLNFKHYISQGLLNSNQISNDLYVNAGTYLGYYTQLKTLNATRDEDIEEQVLIANEIINLTALQQTYQVAATEANEQISSLNTELYTYCGKYYSTYYNYSGTDSMIIQYVQAIAAATENANTYKTLYDNVTAALTTEQGKYDAIVEQLADLVEDKEALNKLFYAKYSKFIQEGSWISEDYTDDDLYYLDAEGVLSTSASPQVTYTIDVVDVSQQADYTNYSFKCGDKSYIEDTEFFGYSYINGMKTPYQEEVVVSEVTRYLDNSASNKITIQNYKTQFEDLFQRITATTQALQYSSGSYDTAASAVNPDGTLTTYTLENSFLNNSITISNSYDQSVVWDTSGITVIDNTDLTKMIRLVGGGLFISSDGGASWTAGITGSGINANYITTGQLDTQKLQILNGAFPAFRWDYNGLSAYNFSGTDDTATFNFNKFVRFDQYGIYGYSGSEGEYYIPTDLDDVIANTKFSLTWEGFNLKSDHTGGYLSITPDKDIRIVTITDDEDEVDRIHLGLLETLVNDDNSTTGRYGLRIRDEDGVISLETSDTGKLLLKDSLTFGELTEDDLGVQIGILNADIFGTEGDDDYAEVHKVFSVKSPFEAIYDHSLEEDEQLAIYEDGTLLANRVKIDSGTIGGVTIDSLVSGQASLVIEPLQGTLLKVSEIAATPDTLTFKAYLSDDSSTDVSSTVWSISYDTNTFTNFATGDEVDFVWDTSKYEDFSDVPNVLIIKATLTLDDKTYSTFTTISILKESASQQDGYSLNSNALEINCYYGQHLDEETGFYYNNYTLFPEKLTYYLVDNNTTEFLDIDYSDISIVLYTSSSSGILNNLSLDFMKDTDVSIYDISTDDTATVSEEVVDKTYLLTEDETTGGYVTFYLQKFLDDFSNGLLNNNSYYNTFLSLNNVLKQSSGYLKTSIIYNSIIHENVVTVKIPIESNLLEFAVTAGSVNALIEDKKMTFDLNGLTIENGNFTITQEEETVLYFNAESNNLAIKGDIYAENGYFNGEVNATTGSIQDYLQIGTNSSFLSLGKAYIWDTDAAIRDELANQSISLSFVDDEDETVSGITLTKNEDNTITVSGTATSDVTISIYNTTFLSDEKWTVDFNSEIETTGFEEIVEETTVTTYFPQLNLKTVDGQINQDLLINADFNISTNPTYTYIELSIKEDQVCNFTIDLLFNIVSNFGLNSSNFKNNPITEEYSGFRITNDGRIIANDLVLGTGATIRDYIQIGTDVVLSSTDNYVLQISDKLLFSRDGELFIGGAGFVNLNNGIYLDGTNKYISNTNGDFVSDNGWRLTEDEAVFMNATIKGTIKASTFEYSEVTGVSGALVIRPSSKVTSVTAISNSNNLTNIALYVENYLVFEEGDYCEFSSTDSLLENQLFQITKIGSADIVESLSESDIATIDETSDAVEEDEQIIVLTSLGETSLTFDNAELLVGQPLLNYGTESSVGIAINSMDTGSFASESLSVFETKIVDGTSLSLENKIILGKLPANEAFGIPESSYGLYAENAYIKGAVYTYDSTATKPISAGINSLSTASMVTDENNPYGFSTTGNVIMWAGAEGGTIYDAETEEYISYNAISSDAISRAKFRIDTEGNMIANSGYFSGTIITDSLIESSEIRTAKITGIGTSEYALTIQDASNGILFSGTVNNQDQQYLALNNQSLTLGVDLKYLLNNTAYTILDMNGYLYPNSIFLTGSNSNISLTNSSLTFQDNVNNLEYILAPSLTKGNLVFKTTTNTSGIFGFENNESISYSDLVFRSNISYGEKYSIDTEEKYLMSDEMIKDNNGIILGYDLYVEYTS